MTEKNQSNKAGLDQHVIDLVNRGVDGELSDQEQQQLDQLKAKSEPVNALYNELLAVARILEETPALEPPEHLQAMIERQIRLPIPDSKSSREKRWLAWVLSAPWLRTGFAMTAVAVIAVGLYQMESPTLSPQDNHNMSGTIAKTPGNRQLPVLDLFDLQSDLMSGQVEVSGNEDMLIMQVHLDTRLPSELLIDFGQTGLAFLSTQQPAREDGYAVQNDTIRISGSGEQDYTLKFRRIGTSETALPMQIEFFANNSLVQSAQISVKNK